MNHVLENAPDYCLGPEIQDQLSCQIKEDKKKLGPLYTEELAKAKQHWVERAQRGIPDGMERPGWKLVKDKETSVLKCTGRIQGYNPVHLEDGPFTQKLIQHVHAQIKHLSVANRMAALREEWWIPQLQTLVNKEICNCNVCKVFTTKPYRTPTTSALPVFRTEVSRPFQYVGIDFAGPSKCKISKTKEEKAYVLIFTCATSRAVHLELTRTQTGIPKETKRLHNKKNETRANYLRRCHDIQDNGNLDQKDS